jgi:hypothetical protein
VARTSIVPTVPTIVTQSAEALPLLWPFSRSPVRVPDTTSKIMREPRGPSPTTIA